MAQTLYYNGSILTMDRQHPRAEALLTDGGCILAVGELAYLEGLAKRPTRVDLDGRALMPGFVDGHSHVMSVGASLKKCDLGECKSFDEILQAITAFRQKHDLTHGERINCCGYDLARLKEGRHPTAALLDSLGFDNPIGCTHASLHMGVYNSVAMRLCGIDDSYTCESGGVVGRDENGHLNGYFEEGAKKPLVDFMADTGDSFEEDFLAAEAYYFRHGVTTVQDGASVNEERINAYKRLAAAGKLRADVRLYLSSRMQDSTFWDRAKAMLDGADRRVRIGGVKIFLDGSPQARTAWMQEPYTHTCDGYRGYPMMTDEAVQAVAERAEREGMQLLAHCNGDAAAEQFIAGYERALSGKGNGSALRPVMIHAQTVRYDQLDRMARIGMMPSFFIGHCYYWGDTHLYNFGKERGSRISPVRSAMQRGLPFSFHQDSPVTRPDMLHSVWCAVNRVTRSGVVVGEENRIDVYDALIGVTNGAAYTYFEEDTRGILKTGAVADLVILDRDPTAVPPMEIKDIRVLETIKGGERVFALA